MSFRSDFNLVSTNRLIKENELLQSKYNQYKRNHNSSKFDFQDNFGLSQSLSKQPEREIPDSDDNNKYENLKQIYDERLRNLYSHIKTMISKIENDDILNTMKNDTTSIEFIHQRIKEIVDENMLMERETTFKKMSEEISELRIKTNSKDAVINELNAKIKLIHDDNENKVKQYEAMFSDAYQQNLNLQNENNNLRYEMQNFQQNFDQELNRKNLEVMKYQKENSKISEYLHSNDERMKEVSRENEELKLEMDRLQKVISVLEIDLNSSENKFNEMQKKIEVLNQENNTNQGLLFEASLKNRKLIEENKSLGLLHENSEKERKNLLEKFSNFNDEISKSEQEKLDNQAKVYKEKINAIKKKTLEYKNTISKLEEDLKSEKAISLNSKINYSQLITKMQEDMKTIKSEWEKRLKQQESEFDLTISELDNKHLTEINYLRNEHQNEIESKLREIHKLKADSESLKNFEKEYIKITQHEELLNEKFNEFKKRTMYEIQLNEEEMEKEYKKKLLKLEEEKKKEFDFLTENIRNNLNSSEKQCNEFKNYIFELESKFKKEKELSENSIEIIENQQRNIKSLNSQVDEYQEKITDLTKKLKQSEEKLKNLSNTNYYFQEDIEGMSSKLESLEKDKFYLTNDFNNKEKYYLEELKKMECIYLECKESYSRKLDQETQNSKQLSIQLNELENICEQKNESIKNKDKQMNEFIRQINEIEEVNQILSMKLKEFEDENSGYLRKVYDLEKTNKQIYFEKSSQSELVIKVLHTKLNSIKNEIKNIKQHCMNEISNVKKDSIKIIENISMKLRNVALNNDKLIEESLRERREILDGEYQNLVNLKEKEFESEVLKISEKYDKHLMDQFKINEKLEKENKHLTDKNHNLTLQNRELNFKIEELEQEIKKHLNHISNLKGENEELLQTLQNIKSDKSINLGNKVSEEIIENVKRELIKGFKIKLNKILSLVASTRKKYHNEISQYKFELENIYLRFTSENSNIVEELQYLLVEEKKVSDNLRLNLDQNEEEKLNIKKDVERLKQIYENKIELLSSKMQGDKQRIAEFKNELKAKHNQMKEINGLTQEMKSQVKTLKTQLEMKNEEISNYKKEFEKLFNVKENKINELQNLISQSYLSYNKGINNIKIANKLDDDIKNMMRKFKIEDVTEGNQEYENTNNGKFNDYAKKKDKY